MLASTSPRRKTLLETLGRPFTVIPPTFEENSSSLAAAEEALHFATLKAQSVAAACHGGLVIGADTLIDLDGVKIGKPRDAKDARDILTRLSGRAHTVITAVVLLNTITGTLQSYIGRTTVTFRTLNSDEINTYVATGEPMGKAGAYAIQENGRRFVTSIDGDEEVVIGLPLAPLRLWLGLKGALLM